MARNIQDAQKAVGKRKRTSDEPTGPELISEKLDLQSLSDQEGEEDASSEGSVEEFPEVDLGDDTEEEEGSSEAGDEVEESSEPSDEEDAESDEDVSDESVNEDEDDADRDSDDVHIYSKSKDVVSDITGQVKRVYPDIDPEYDSDSSTEDVCAFFYFIDPIPRF
jgi:ribosome biogenesis protein ERB1